MFNRIITLSLLASLLGGASVFATSCPCPVPCVENCEDALSGTRGTLAASILKLTPEAGADASFQLQLTPLRGCGYEVEPVVVDPITGIPSQASIHVCQANVTNFYGWSSQFDLNDPVIKKAEACEDDSVEADKGKPTKTTPECVEFKIPKCTPTPPCFGTGFLKFTCDPQDPSNPTPVVGPVRWTHAEEYLIRTSIKFCEEFCDEAIPSIVTTLQLRVSPTGITTCDKDAFGNVQGTNVLYQNGFPLARIEVHPFTVRTVGGDPIVSSPPLPVPVPNNFFETAVSITLFTADKCTADTIMQGFFSPVVPGTTDDNPFLPRFHFIAAKRCNPCCTVNTCPVTACTTP